MREAAVGRKDARPREGEAGGRGGLRVSKEDREPKAVDHSHQRDPSTFICRPGQQCLTPPPSQGHGVTRIRAHKELILSQNPTERVHNPPIMKSTGPYAGVSCLVAGRATLRVIRGKLINLLKQSFMS